MKRFGVSMESELLSKLDNLMEEKGYANRSEILRDLVREKLTEKEWKSGKSETIGTLTLVYDHHHHLQEKLTDLQHDYHKNILSTTHIHMDEHNCLEILILKGKGKTIQQIANKLIATKGVKIGKLSAASTGKNI